MDFLAYLGDLGDAFFGAKDGSAGPCDVWYHTEPYNTATGTIGIDTAGVVTGVGTALLTEFSVGDRIVTVAPAGTVVYEFTAITTATAATVIDANTRLAPTVAVTAGATFKKYMTIWLGKTDENGVTVGFAEELIDIKHSQTGSTIANNFSSGINFDGIKMSLTEASLERIKVLFEGAVATHENVTTGITDAMAFGSRIGRNFKANSHWLTLIKYGADGTPSALAQDRLDLFSTHPMVSMEIKKDSKSQDVWPIVFKIYLSDTKKISGKPYFGAIGESLLTWD